MKSFTVAILLGILSVLSGCATVTREEVASTVPSEVTKFYSVTPIYFDDGMVWVRGDPVSENTLGAVFEIQYLHPESKATSPFKYVRVGNLYTTAIPKANIKNTADDGVIIQPARKKEETLHSSAAVNYSIAVALGGNFDSSVAVARNYELKNIISFDTSGLKPNAAYCAHPEKYLFVRGIHEGKLGYNITKETNFKATGIFGLPGNELHASEATTTADTKIGGLVLELVSVNDACGANDQKQAPITDKYLAFELQKARDRNIAEFEKTGKIPNPLLK